MQLDRKGSKATPELLATQEILVLLGLVVTLVTLDQLVIREQQVQKATKETLVPTGQQEALDRPVKQVVLVKQVTLELLETQEPLVRRAIKEIQEQMVQQEQLEPLENVGL